MSHPVTLSKSRLMTFLDCPRKLWLEQYNPELEEPRPEIEAARETGLSVGRMARRIYGDSGGFQIAQERGLRHAIEQTNALIGSGFSDPIFEATFEHDGLVVQVDVFDPSAASPRLIEVKSSTHTKERYVDDCAIQAWTLAGIGTPPEQSLVAHINSEFVYRGDGQYAGLFIEHDLTEAVQSRIERVDEMLAGARATLRSLDEPDVRVGEHCTADYKCPFFEHCMPEQGRYPVTGLGGRKSKIYDWINAGHRDIRDIPESELSGDVQKRIWRQSTRQEAFVDDKLKQLLGELAVPRYYLDFETISFAVPIWEDTRPYEAVPFQWSCHIERSADAGEQQLGHEEFLDVSGAAPMRSCAEALLAALGQAGPILVYTSFEKTVINSLANRFDDLADRLYALTKRLVDLHSIVKANYYHPDMLGSWSLKSVLPTIQSRLDYERLGIQDGMAAQRAYLEAIDRDASDSRREALALELREYCRHDSLALYELVDFFGGRA